MSTKFLNQSKLTSTVTPTNSAIAAGDDGQVALEKAQGQINQLRGEMSSGSFTPVPHNLQVNGTPTYTGAYTTNGPQTFVSMRIRSTLGTSSNALLSYGITAAGVATGAGPQGKDRS